MIELTAEELKRRVIYDPVTGVMTRRRASGRHGRYQVGLVMGTKAAIGYLSTSFDGKPFYVHRLAWLYVYGAWPAGCIDHINGDKADNRIDNLRDVSALINSQNMRRPHPRNKSAGVIGVSWVPTRQKYRARIRVGGKNIPLGSFKTLEEAASAYLNAKRRLHPGCTI